MGHGGVRRVAAWVIALGLAPIAIGCGAESAGEVDAGGGPRDAGSIDAHVPAIDAGTPARDAGRDAGARDAGSDAGPQEDDAGAADAGPRTVASCFEGAFVGPAIGGPDYDVFGPTVGSHCLGTNHQDITGVERVVFLGDSVTVGTPPTSTDDLYRSRLADALATRFGLDRPLFAYDAWKNVNVLDGTSGIRDAGPFSSCAKWGARTDDLLPEAAGDMEYQLGPCFPMDRRDERTLVVMTIGGNDIAALTKAGFEETATIPELWDETRAFVQRVEDAIVWLTDATRFPGGVYVVFSNMYEFTDATGDVESCPAADLGGFGGEWADPTALEDMVIWANEQYGRIAVDHGVDMIFMLEHFCGHGFHSDDPSAPCYRGPGTPRWFDLTCTHPNPEGHRQIADMFLAVIGE